MEKFMKRKDSAVSPVVGVLLMLVVTLIIAAVVSGFAGGLAGGQEKAPQLSLEVQTGYGYDKSGNEADPNKFDISFKHLGGDTIATKDVAIVTTFTGSDGKIWTHKQTANSVPSLVSTTGPRYARVPYVYDIAKYSTYYLNQAEIEAGSSALCWWGEASFGPGQVMRTFDTNSTAYFLGLNSDEDAFPQDTTSAPIGTEYLKSNITYGSPVDIKWIHTPSNKVIFEKTITLGR